MKMKWNRKFRVLTGFIQVIAFLWAGNVTAQEVFPVKYLRHSVLIKMVNRLPATGFYIRDSSNVFLITAKHVLLDSTSRPWSDEALISSPPRDIYEGQLFEANISLRELLDNGYLKYHKEHDVAVLRIGGMIPEKKGFNLTTGIKRISGTSVSGLLLDNIRTYDDVAIGNEVYVIAYPSALGIKNIPQFDHSRPLLRKGIVAGKYNAGKKIVLDCAIYKGNSGSPVYYVTRPSLTKIRFEIIGIVSQFIPFDEIWVNKTLRSPSVFYSNSGYSVIEPIDTVLELVSTFP